MNRIGIGLVAAVLMTGCGGSPNAPSSPGLSISAMTVQIQNESDGSHGYIVNFTVHNGGPSNATLLGVAAGLSANGTPVDAFEVGFGAGRPVAVSQDLSPAITTFTAPASIPIADSLTLTVRYDAGSGEQTVSRTAALK
jgi:hypothetical protein